MTLAKEDELRAPFQVVIKGVTKGSTLGPVPYTVYKLLSNGTTKLLIS